MANHTTNHFVTSLLATTALLVGAVGMPACGAGGEAGAPDACVDCPEAATGQLRVANAAARACEVLLEASNGRVVSIDFDGGALGQMVREGDRAGISIISQGAGPLPERPISLGFTGQLSLLSSACYDEGGRVLPGEGLAL